MAYDEELAQRIREIVAMEPGLREKKMFGGLAFLIDGHISIAASGQGGALIGVDRADAAHLVGSTEATVAVMGGRPMSGWLRVDSDTLRTTSQLTTWVRRSVAYARTLPAKRSR